MHMNIFSWGHASDPLYYKLVRYTCRLTCCPPTESTDSVFAPFNTFSKYYPIYYESSLYLCHYALVSHVPNFIPRYLRMLRLPAIISVPSTSRDGARPNGISA